jgi:hypothetical protein
MEDKFTSPVEEESEVMFISQGMINGSHWKSFNEKQKWAYLFGFEDGTIYTAIHYLPNEKSKERVYASLPTSAENVSFEYLIKEIDKFYLNDKNVDIPISYVLLIIRNRLLGIDEDKIQRYIKYLRNPADKDLEKIIRQKE